MGRYGNGCDFVGTLMSDKDRIKHAFNNEIWLDEEDENGFVYEKCTKEEAQKEILDIFEELVFHSLEFLGAGNALSKILEEKGFKSKDYFSSYFEKITEENQKLLSKYKFEDDEENEEKGI